MTRLTFAGAIFLTLIAILPSLLSQGLHVPTITAQFFGGTSLLIIVGVILDTMRQVETHLIQRHYDGFLRKGRIRGRAFDRSAYNRGDAAQQGTLMWLYVGIAVLVIGGVAIFLYGR
jgi:preprotein translocase subunit SecY